LYRRIYKFYVYEMFNRLRVIEDSLYGQVKIPKVINLLIDQPFFQRLRKIKQLGFTNYVYPTGIHDRFQHSIGTFHLARQWLESLKLYPEIKERLTKRDEYCVYIAGLYHDIGHGPFSHFWDGIFIKRERSLRNDKEISHEEMSIKIVRHVFNENKEKLLNDYELGMLELRKIEAMIMGKDIVEYMKTLPTDEKVDLPEEEKDKGFLYMIISNHETEIDVDKWDYLQRDNRACFVKSREVHVERLFESLFFRKNNENNKWEMVAIDKDYANVRLIFQDRHHMHRQVYQHKTVQAIEQMVYDAIHKSKKCEEFYLRSTKGDLNEFFPLNDGILDQLENEDRESDTFKIIDRINHRQLYKRISSASIVMKDYRDLNLTENQIEDEIETVSGISKEKFFLRLAKFDYAGPDNNPMDKLIVVSKNGDDVDVANISNMNKLNSKPEYDLRIFIRETNVDVKLLINKFREILSSKSKKFRFMNFF
jgi:HD superfamily phosphohydrolase